MLVKIAEVLDADIHEVLYGPAAHPDRKDDYVRFAVAAGTCLVLWISMFLLDDITREWYFNTFITFPRVLQYTLFLPFAFFCTGWTLMQLLSLFTGLRPLKGNYIVWVRRGIWVVLIDAFLYMLPFFISMVWGDIGYLIAKAQGIKEYHHVSPIQLTQLHHYIIGLLNNHPFLLGLFGAALWLCGFPKKKQ